MTPYIREKLQRERIFRIKEHIDHWWRIGRHRTRWQAQAAADRWTLEQITQIRSKSIGPIDFKNRLMAAEARKEQTP